MSSPKSDDTVRSDIGKLEVAVASTVHWTRLSKWNVCPEGLANADKQWAKPLESYVEVLHLHTEA